MMQQMMKRCFLPLIALGLCLAACACAGKAGADSASRNDKAGGDRPIAGFQADLLSLAFDTATAIPSDPHIKDRCKAQEAVVKTSLDLRQPERARGYAEKIDDWRRGACYADLALYLTQQHATKDVRHYLDLATEIAATTGTEDWCRDTIKVKVARTHVLLGNIAEADRLSTGVVDSETGKIASVKAMVSDSDSFDKQLKALDAPIATGNLDLLKNAHEACAQLFNRFYSDTKRRSLAEKKIKSSWDKVPVILRIDLLAELAGFAVNHSDNSKALELINEARTLVDGYNWPLEDRIAMTAKLCRLRFRAGEKQRAHSELDAVNALYRKDGGKTVDIWRAGALRPMAEAYQSVGDRSAALAAYKQAVEEGAHNPNSRPRAEDLSATCCSMAVSGVEPDQALWARVRQIRNGLGEPW